MAQKNQLKQEVVKSAQKELSQFQKELGELCEKYNCFLDSVILIKGGRIKTSIVAVHNLLK